MHRRDETAAHRRHGAPGAPASEDGALREDVTVDHADNVLWTLLSFGRFDLLYSGRELSIDQAVDLIVTTAERALCK